jgi:hypothetical protein
MLTVVGVGGNTKEPVFLLIIYMFDYWLYTYIPICSLLWALEATQKSLFSALTIVAIQQKE